MIKSKANNEYKIGIYVRESRDDNDENYETIETQRDLLKAFVEKKNLGQIVKMYIDNNVSGSGFDRVGIDMLTKDVREGKISLLVIKDLSRLGRNNAKTLLFLDFLEEYSVRVITFDGKYDSVRDNDTVGIHTWYNEHYIRDISKKIRANLRFKIEKGEYIGNAPFGYKKDLNNKNKLVVDHDTAYIIKLIFKLYREGNGYTNISKMLDLKGYPTPSKKSDRHLSATTWNPVSVKRILFNRVYIGDTVQGISERVSFKSKKTRRLPEDRWVITRRTHEPIISEEDFNKVNKIRQTKVNFKMPNKGTLHLLKDLIFCGKCGKAMYARKRRNMPMSYICSTYFKFGVKGCSSHKVNEDLLVNIIKKEVEKILQIDDNKKSTLKFLELVSKEEETLKFEIEKIEKLLMYKQKQQEVIYLDMLEGRISKQLFYRANQNTENKISELVLKIKKIEEKISGNNSQKKINDPFSNSQIDVYFDDFIYSNHFMKYLIERILIFDKEDFSGDLNFIAAEDVFFKDSAIIYFNT